MQRIVVIKNREVYEDYWLTEADTIYNHFNYSPEFNSQIENFYKYLDKKLKYSKEARMRNLEKRVIISFIVQKNGDITNIKSLTNHGYGLEENVIETIKTYKYWGIIKYQDIPVSLYLRLPIRYKLK